MRAIIAGGRKFTLDTYLLYWLDGLHAALRFDEVVSGHYGECDLAGERWANQRKIKVELFPAAWKALGPAAGPIRNREMAAYAAVGVREDHPDFKALDQIVVADAAVAVLFPGGKGTASMKEEAEARGIRIIEWSKDRGAARPDAVKKVAASAPRRGIIRP